MRSLTAPPTPVHLHRGAFHSGQVPRQRAAHFPSPRAALPAARLSGLGLGFLTCLPVSSATAAAATQLPAPKDNRPTQTRPLITSLITSTWRGNTPSSQGYCLSGVFCIFVHWTHHLGRNFPKSMCLLPLHIWITTIYSLYDKEQLLVFIFEKPVCPFFFKKMNIQVVN